MERVLWMLSGILPHLFIFSVIGLFSNYLFPSNPFAVILGVAGFLGLSICVYTLVMNLIYVLVRNR